MAPVEKCRHPFRQLPHHGRDIKGEQLAVAHQHPPVDGTWNLENLYRPGGPFGPKDKAAYDTKLAALAAVITELDPALLGVQEAVEPEALDDLVGMLDGDWHVALSQHPDGRGIRTAGASGSAFSAVRRWRCWPTRTRSRRSCAPYRRTTRVRRCRRRGAGSSRWRSRRTQVRCGWPWPT